MSLLEAYIILSILRLLVPFTIFRWPLIGILLSAYMDAKDFNYLPLELPVHYEAYQIWDKIFDTYYLAIAAIVSLRWKDKLVKKIAIYSFLYRLLGVIIFPIVGLRSLLILFPNFFEGFFIFYIVYTKITKKQKLFSSKLEAIIIVTALLIPAITREYFMHVIKTPPWDRYDISKILNIPRNGLFNFDISYWLWIIIFLLLPLTALIWKIKKAPLGWSPR